MNNVRLPDARPRTEYDASPLSEVVCQLRFPKLLAIESRPPVEFQNRIIEAYPELEARDALAFAFASVSGAELPQLPSASKVYDFHSEDRSHRITLTNDFIALSADRYANWTDFRGRLVDMTKALLGVYDVRTFSRVGLRYINTIEPSGLGLADVPTADLLKPALLGIGAVEDFKASSYQAVSTIPTRSGVANLRFAFDSKPEAGRSIVIDWDLFSDDSRKASTDDVIGLLDQFHEDGSQIFRWCVEERLHQAFRPRTG